MSPTRRLRPLATTLIGGVVFLLPLIFFGLVISEALKLAWRIVAPIAPLLPTESIGSVAAATLAAVALLVAVCFAAGTLARAAIGRRWSQTFEDRLAALYPRYHVFKAMTQGLQGGAVGREQLRPVVATFDDHEVVAFDIDRLADSRVVVFLPGAPDVWLGSVVILAADRVRSIDVDSAAPARSMQGLGRRLQLIL